jgi:hypothetical protein
VGEEPNHTTARKPGPLYIIQNSLVLLYLLPVVLDLLYLVPVGFGQILHLPDGHGCQAPHVGVCSLIPEMEVTEIILAKVSNFVSCRVTVVGFFLGFLSRL